MFLDFFDGLPGRLMAKSSVKPVYINKRNRKISIREYIGRNGNIV